MTAEQVWSQDSVIAAQFLAGRSVQQLTQIFGPATKGQIERAIRNVCEVRNREEWLKLVKEDVEKSKTYNLFKKKMLKKQLKELEE